MTLTLEACRAATPGTVLKCHVVRGLQLHVTPTGKSWKLYYRAGGTQRRPVLGYFPALTIELARAAARDMLAAVARGGDPSRDRQDTRLAPTVADLGAVYLEARAKRNKPRTTEEMARHIRTINECIGHVKAAAVTTAHVEMVMEYVGERRGIKKALKDKRYAAKVQRAGVAKTSAPSAANHVRETLRGMLRHAELPSLRWREPHTNPVMEVPRNRENKRRTLLAPEHVPAVWAALNSLEASYPVHVAALWTILFAGTRVTETLSVRREQWHGDRFILTEHKTDRTGNERIIYLPTQVQTRLAGLAVSPEGYLFGGLDRYNIFHVWEKARVMAGCPAVAVRDFRRTFISTGLARGATLEQLGELASHSSTETTKGYAWLVDTGAAKLAQNIADELERQAAVETKP